MLTAFNLHLKTNVLNEEKSGRIDHVPIETRPTTTINKERALGVHFLLLLLLLMPLASFKI